MTKPRPPTRRRAEARKRPGAAAYRVNARLDAESHDKLVLLELQTGLSTSDVLREALGLLFAQRVAPHREKRKSLDRLVGKFSGGPADLSENYKTHLTTSLADKHRRP